MDNQYYFPQIQELFIGFECELFFQDDRKLAPTKNNKWHQVKLDKNRFQQAHSLLGSKKIRVRNLCKEDIESLGWKDSGSGKIFQFSNDESKILFSDHMPNKWSIYEFQGDCINRDQGMPLAFNFTIKNKSELLKIMQQIELV